MRHSAEVAGASQSYDIAVVVTTYNRATTLARALESLLRQTCNGFRYEIVAVDNNSTDGTRQVVEALIARGHSNVRYVFERRQGASYGRNAGIIATSASIVAFTDDDLHVTPTWLGSLYGALEEHPEVDYVGGKVLPSSRTGWPTWATREHWSPLALFDYGDKPFYVNRGRAVCLGTANSAYRKTVFERVGYFDTQLQTLKRKSATEDHELQLRVWRSGGQGLWVPTAVVMSDVASDRLTKAYHRQWQGWNGHCLAIMHDEAIEDTRVGRLFGVPGHIYRRAVQGLVGALAHALRGNLDRAFAREIQTRWCMGFIGARWREYVSRAFVRRRRAADHP